MSKRNDDKKKITRAVYDKAQPHPDGKSVRIIWDDALGGFGLRIRPNGNRSFVYVYRFAGKPKWVTIDAADADSARAIVTKMVNQRAEGRDPGEERRAAEREAERRGRAFSTADVLDTFIAEHAKKKLKKKTYDEYERIVDKVLKPELGKIKIDALDTHDVATLYEKLKKQPRTRFLDAKKPAPPALTQAAGAIRVLSSALRWAIEDAKLRLGPNPARIRLPTTRQRDWSPTIEQVARLMAKTDEMEREKNIAPQVAVAIRLLFSTGCRGDEICNLKWDDIDADMRFIRWPDTKTGYLRKAVSTETREILEAAPRFGKSPWVCPGIKDNDMPLRVDVCRKGFKKVMKAAGVVPTEHVALHLTRHWFSSEVAADKSLTQKEQMRLTGHKSAQAFQRYVHLAEEGWTEQADDTAARRRARLEAAASGKVVSIRGGKK